MDIIHAVIKAAGWTMVHSLWQGAILYIVLILILKLSPKLSSASKHNLSFLGLMSIFLWSGITFYSEISKALPVQRAPLNFIQSQYSPTIANIPDIPLTVSYQIERYFPVLVFIYAIGFLIQISFLLIDYYKLRKTKTTGLTDLPSDLYQRCLDLIARSGIKRKVRFHISSRVSVPLVIGYLKPLVLLPLSAIARLEPEQFEAIIIHELSHIRRNDYLLNLMKLFVETILFFNPFVLLTGRIIKNERENACDDLVLELTGAPLLYIETLYQIQQLKYDQEQFSMAITGKGYTLLNRIKRIATLERTKDSQKQPLALSLILTVLLFAGSILCISWLNPEIKQGKLISKNAKNAVIKLTAIINEQMLMTNKPAVPTTIKPADITADTTKTVTNIKAVPIFIKTDPLNPRQAVAVSSEPGDSSWFAKFKVLQSKWTAVWDKHWAKWTPAKEAHKTKWSRIWEKQYSKEEASQLAAQQKTEWDKITADEAKERADLSAINKIESDALQAYSEKLKAAGPPSGYVRSPVMIGNRVAGYMSYAGEIEWVDEGNSHQPNGEKLKIEKLKVSDPQRDK